MTQVTEILSQAANGDAQAASKLLPLVYDELRRLASHRLAHEAGAQSVNSTALVHEAYLRLVGHSDRAQALRTALTPPAIAAGPTAAGLLAGWT